MKARLGPRVRAALKVLSSEGARCRNRRGLRGAAPCWLAITLLVGCVPHAREAGRASAAHAEASASVSAPRASAPGQVAQTAARVCRAERVLSFEPAEGRAGAKWAPEFAAALSVAEEAAGSAQLVDFDRLGAALFAGILPANPSAQVDICAHRGQPRNSFADATQKSDRVRVFDTQWSRTTGSSAPLLIVLWSNDALNALVNDATAHFEVALLDQNYAVLARTAFETERPAERTLDGVGAYLELQHGLVHARVAFGCPGAKYGERFDVPIRLASSPVCARADESTFPPTEYPKVVAPSSCVGAPVMRASPRPLPSYEATQDESTAWFAMPYVEGDAAGLDVDWLRTIMILTPRSAEPPERATDEADSQRYRVGSLDHTTPRWSRVVGASVRLHQLLPVRDASGTEAYLTLYSRASPRELLSRSQTGFRLALLSPAYEVLSDVALDVQSPPAGYLALQTGLELRAGQPLAQVRYLRSAPAPAAAASEPAPSGAVDLAVKFALDLERGCLARTPGLR